MAERDTLSVKARCGHRVTVHIPGGIKGPIPPGKLDATGRRNATAGRESLCTECQEATYDGNQP
jgi:hypothetical protein